MAIPVSAILPQAASAESVAKTALLNGESITTEDGFTNEKSEPISLEQAAAEKAGYTVTVVSGAEWDAMSAAQFAQYQVLIVGDPHCSVTAESAVSDASTWASAVMGTSGASPLVGNRVVVGTDPEWHYPSHNGAEHLVQDGITFAGGVSGATGAYFDTSCGDQSEGKEIMSVLELLTTSTGHWTTNTSPPCGGSVQQVAANPVFDTGESKLLDSDIQGWGCSDHVTFPTFPADWFPLAVATDTPSHPTCGTDPETATEVCGEAYVLLAGRGIVAEAPNITLTPKTGSSPAGGTHSVTAYVHKEEKPVVGTVVTFVVTGQNAGVTGTCTTSGGAADPECKTDEEGKVVFTYSDAKGAGEDTIVGSVTLETPVEEIGARVAGSRSARVLLTTEQATAAQVWTPVPVVTPPTPAPAPVTAVLAAKEVKPAKGTATIASIRGCIARSSYVASVHGSSIASVTFKLDGHTVKTLHKPTSGSTYAVRLNLRAGSAHHVTMHVVFTSTSKTATETLHQTVARCAVHRALPRFTG
ncbi:MAG TPA: hypothetical protein VN772_06105 [Solirubrobacteraceae bacterium]|nr:hypothetical protein [Solirubrobacteraceae bacterium]